jgi:hypothetical protein
MIKRCLLCLLAGVALVAVLAFIGPLIDQHPRVFVGLGICALAAICYVELDAELGRAAKRGY